MTKPIPIPTLTGKAAEEFERQIREPPTEEQRAIWVEADRVYDAIKQRKTKP